MMLESSPPDRKLEIGTSATRCAVIDSSMTSPRLAGGPAAASAATSGSEAGTGGAGAPSTSRVNATDRASAEDNAFAPPIATAAEPETAVTLAVAALAKRRGSWVRVHGRISPRIVEAARVQRRRVIIGERVRGHWRPAARGHTAPGGTFSILVPLLSGRRRKLLLRATIVGVGRSNTAVLRFS